MKVHSSFFESFIFGDDIDNVEGDMGRTSIACRPVWIGMLSFWTEILKYLDMRVAGAKQRGSRCRIRKPNNFTDLFLFWRIDVPVIRGDELELDQPGTGARS